MTVYSISAASTVLYLTPSDLQERGLRADNFSKEDLLNLIPDTMRQRWIPSSTPLEIDVFPSECGLLVFIHIDKVIWIFRDFEVLLSALLTLDAEHTNCRLYWWDDLYWIILSGQDAKHNAILSEFGTSAYDDPYIASRLEEYGTLLLDYKTLPIFHRCFQSQKRELQ